MSRYTGPSWKLSRRLGISLSGTGKEIARRPYAPGQHGPNSRKKLSEYGQQLQEKQKLRHMYGMNERQFATLFKKAGKIKEGKHGENFMVLLEQRLDNVVYRLGLATTRRQARQLVNHGHIKLVNNVMLSGKKTVAQKIVYDAFDIVKEKTGKEALEALYGRPEFVTFDEDKLEGSLNRLPLRDELTSEVDESLVVEYYNKQL